MRKLIFAIFFIALGVIGTLYFQNPDNFKDKFNQVKSLTEKTTPISDIMENATELDGETVKIKGKVLAAKDILLTKYLSIEDETGSIFVRPKKGKELPTEGDIVTISGKVREGLKLGENSLVFLEQQ